MSVRLNRVVSIVLLFTGFTSVYGQGKIADSLHQVLTRNVHDTTRVKALLELAGFYAEVNADSALRNANRARKIVELKELNRYLPSVLRNLAVIKVVQGDYVSSTFYLHQAISKCNADSSRYLKREKALAYNLLGVIIDYKSDYDSALFFYFKSLELFNKLNDKMGIMNRYNNIGVVYKHLGNYSLSLRYLMEGIKNAPDIRSTDRLMQNLGEVYLAMNEFAKAKGVLRQALKLYNYDKDEPDNTGEALVNAMLGNLYSSTGKSDSAIYYLSHALRINETAKHSFGMAENHLDFAVHYKNNKRWDLVVKEAGVATRLHKEAGEKYGMAKSNLVLAEAYLKTGEVEKSLSCSTLGLELSKEIKAKELQRGYLELLANLYAKKNNYSQAYYFSNELNALKDSINNEEKIKQVANMEALYENDKKEKELALVRAQKLTTDAQLSEEETKATLLIVGLGLVTLLLIMGAFAYRALKRNRKMLETKNEELRRLNQTKDRFFAIVGHDLRGPITSFSGINDLLNWYISKNDLEKIKVFGGKITQSVRQLDTLLNNLLNWAMSQTDAVPYRPEPLQLKQLIMECYGYFQHSLEVKQITLTDDTADDLFVFADKNALSSVLRNLLSNATKFTPSNGSIKISARLVENFVWVDIADSGVGLPEEKIKTIFSLSENKTTSGTAGEKGTGLGLLLCADYVALNKGTIKVESKVGEGTVFSFSIPSFQPQELQQLKQEMING